MDSHSIFTHLQASELLLIKDKLSKRDVCAYIKEMIRAQVAPVICIIGGSGSGKTTLSKELAKYLHATLIQEESYHIKTRKERRHILYKTRDPHAVTNYIRFRMELKKLKGKNNGFNIPIIVEGTNRKTLKMWKYDMSIYLHATDTMRYLARITRGGEHDRLLPGENLIEEFTKRQDIEHFPSTLPCMSKTHMVLHRSINVATNQIYYNLYKNNSRYKVKKPYINALTVDG